jgi:hypothetical protein
MYYGTAVDMEVKPTVACNEAIAQSALASAGGADRTAPTVWIPQRHPWNPGAVNFGPQYGYQQKSFGPDFIVWTFVHDTATGGLLELDREAEIVALAARQNVLGEILQPEDIAATVVFLLLHAEQVTGEVVRVDGGGHLGGRLG